MRAQSDAFSAAVGSHYAAATVEQWGSWIHLSGTTRKTYFTLIGWE